MLLYIMLYVMLAALSNAVCLYNAFFLLLIFANAFYFMLCLSLLTHSLFITLLHCIIIVYVLLLYICIYVLLH